MCLGVHGFPKSNYLLINGKNLLTYVSIDEHLTCLTNITHTGTKLIKDYWFLLFRAFLSLRGSFHWDSFSLDPQAWFHARNSCLCVSPKAVQGCLISHIPVFWWPSDWGTNLGSLERNSSQWAFRTSDRLGNTSRPRRKSNFYAVPDHQETWRGYAILFNIRMCAGWLWKQETASIYILPEAQVHLITVTNYFHQNVIDYVPFTS